MIHSMTGTLFRTACGLLLLAASAGIQAQDALENLADRLVRMHGQVDELQNELNIKREEHKNRMAYLTAQLSELEATRDREEDGNLAGAEPATPADNRRYGRCL